jgi:hypothetical protein
VPEHQECIQATFGPDSVTSDLSARLLGPATEATLGPKATESPEAGAEKDFLANPFATDVYLLGNLIKEDFVRVSWLCLLDAAA